MSKWRREVRVFLCMIMVLIIGGCAGQTSHQNDQPLPPRVDADPVAAEHLREGNRLFGKRELRKATKEYEAAIHAQSTLGEAHYNLGLALHKQGRYSESRSHFVKAAKLEPANPVIRNAPPFRQYGTNELDLANETHVEHGDHHH